MGTLSEDLTAIKNVEDTLIANKVARFSYTDTAYTNNDADGVDTYNVNNEQNIPNPTTLILKVNSTVLDKGYRAQASSITRMLVNHFFGRVSYNLNKINDNMSALIATLRAHTGTANGFATLDENGRIPYSQLPESAVELKGYWNASTNTPTLADGTGTNGDEYFVDTAGSQDLGSGTQYFKVGDRVVYTGGIWKNIDSGAIRTINGQAPNPQGERSVIAGQNIPMTRGFLGAVFGRLLGRVWKQGTGGNTAYTTLNPVYANGLWVCGSDSHGIWWSEDGKSWTQGTGGNTSYTMQYLVYANGLWVCGSDSHGIWWSEDGKSWTQGTGGNTSYTMQNLYYINNLWVCGSVAHGVWWSEDGKSWTQGTGGNTSYDVKKIVYANGLYISMTASSSTLTGLWWSENGKAWTQANGTSSFSAGDLLYGNGLWVCIGAKPYWSTDGKNWTQGTGFGTYVLLTLAYANGTWLCTTYQHGVWYSTNGKDWTQCTSDQSTFTSRTGVAKPVYANNIWVCVLDVGIWYSQGGTSWSLGTGNGAVYGGAEAPEYMNGLFICTSNQPSIRFSEDGRYWTQGIGVNATYKLLDVIYANGFLMCGSDSHGCWYSSIDDLITDGVINLGADIPLVNS